MGDGSHLTCIACRLVFDALDAQRAHYKSPFHCFNLHRRSTNQPPVTEAAFEEKVAALRAEKEAGEKNGRAMRRQQRRQQHLPPQMPPSADAAPAPSTAGKFTVNLTVLDNDFENESRRRRAAEAAAAAEKASPAAGGDDELEEELDEDAALDALIEERLRTASAIPPTVSLFDGHESETVEENARYMERTFGLFIPDQEYLKDLRGMLTYLGEKVGVGYTCLWCDRSFRSVRGAQQHMIDKGHSKTRFYGYEDEFGDFFSWGDDAPVAADDASGERALLPLGARPEEELFMVLADNGLEMVLPNGKTLGHRALLRYYGQRAVRLPDVPRIGGPAAAGPARSELRRSDLRAQSGVYMRLGMKNNRLSQKHFRAQVDV